MTDNFLPFADSVHLWLDELMKAPERVFKTDISGDELYELYLRSFPEGTNPVFKERTEHDCNCCKHFIRNIGNIVQVQSDASVKTVWDYATVEAPYPYNEVAKVLQAQVQKGQIVDRYLTSEGLYGKRTTQVQFEGNPTVVTFSHFYTGKSLQPVLSNKVGTELNRFRTAAQVFERGLNEFRQDAMDTVISLINANNLYRGEEHLNALNAFYTAYVKYHSLSSAIEKNRYIWLNSDKGIAMFRNTVIGTLVQDLSEGKELDQAVRMFESKVAPTNYKRTTALVTPKMIENAMNTIRELGLEEALERRFARISDVNVNDVIWVDSTVKPLMKGGLKDLLLDHVASTQTVDFDKIREKAEVIHVDELVSRILPETTSMDIWFSNEHVGNMMSLTAPVHPEPKALFKWNNDFAWSYGGNVTDSIKERVKRAGGRTENTLLRVSLSWFNYDDLDIHVMQPSKNVIYYGHMHGDSGGVLDVDMNVSPTTREAVENVVWTNRLPDGEYKVSVKNFNRRETIDFGFVIEVEHDNKILNYAYNKLMLSGAIVDVIRIQALKGKIAKITALSKEVVSTSTQMEKWGLTTNQWVKVKTVTYSPNYWGENKVGNKHTFFVLDGANNAEPTRGIYNEFLNNKLEPHRKVFELIGEKTKCPPTNDQLSGLGFSSTRKSNFYVKVMQGKQMRIFNVQTG